MSEFRIIVYNQLQQKEMGFNHTDTALVAFLGFFNRRDWVITVDHKIYGTIGEFLEKGHKHFKSFCNS
jgi:hypothetical protein